MKTLKVLVVVVVVVTGMFGVGNVEAGWRDKLKSAGEGIKKAAAKTKEAGRRTKEKWEASERRCDMCNKVVHGRSRCTSCQAKRVSESVKRGADRAKKTYDSLEHPCPVCGAKTRLAGKCSRCLSKSVQAGGRRAVQVGREAAEKSKRAAEKTKEMYGRARQQYGRILDKTRDPEVRRKVTETVGAALELRRQFVEAKRKGTYKGIAALADLPVRGKDGSMTSLGDLLSEKLLRECPGLAGTGIADDPAATVAAVILTDREYFLKEMKFVNKGGRNVSVYTAVEESSAFSSVKASKAFKVMAATERVANTYYTGEDSVEALISVADAINSMND